jgi:hypothetical protein
MLLSVVPFENRPNIHELSLRLATSSRGWRGNHFGSVFQQELEYGLDMWSMYYQ